MARDTCIPALYLQLYVRQAHENEQTFKGKKKKSTVFYAEQDDDQRDRFARIDDIMLKNDAEKQTPGKCNRRDNHTRSPCVQRNLSTKQRLESRVKPQPRVNDGALSRS